MLLETGQSAMGFLESSPAVVRIFTHCQGLIVVFRIFYFPECIQSIILAFLKAC